MPGSTGSQDPANATLSGTVKPLVVLDKDYLQGSKPAAIEQLCRDYCVLMPEALFFELLTCGRAIRSQCYAKFPAQDNPVALMPLVGKLIRFEWKKRKPARPLYAHRLLKESFRFNARLAAGDLEFTSGHERGIAAWRRDVDKDADRHVELCRTIHRIFPGIVGKSGRARASGIADARSMVANHLPMVREACRTFGHRLFPQAPDFDGRWVFFRWMQVHLLACLKHVSRRGIDKPPLDRQELEHDVIDMQYQILGTLVGRLASRDGNVKKVVSELLPDAVILDVGAGAFSTWRRPR